MFKFPWGDFHSLNLGWFLQKFNELREDWATAKAGIDGALDAEIQKAEDALTDVFAARDAAAASASAANSSAQNASSSALSASQSSIASMDARDAARQAATNAAASETAAGNSATAAAGSATAAGNSATAAAGSATAAAASETAAAASETAAGNSATAAAGSATAAAASETAAGQSATDTEEAAASVEASAQQIATNTTDIIKLKELLNEITISRKILSLIKTYPNGSVSAGNRTFTVKDNIVSSSGTGSNTTYYQINLTGSVLRARSGSKSNFTVYDEDFVSTNLINRFPADSWYSMLFKKYVIAPPESTTEAGYMYIFGKKANDETIYRNIQTISLAYNIALDIRALLNDYEEFAIYYTRGVSNANRNNTMMFEFDITRPVTKVIDAIASTLENP